MPGKGADYVFLLNIDTVLEDNLLEELVKYSRGVAVTIPKIYSTRDKVNIWYANGGDYVWVEEALEDDKEIERVHCNCVKFIERYNDRPFIGIKSIVG